MQEIFIWSNDRNNWLMLDDDALFRLCRHEFYKAQGRGGQKRNKTSNAIRLTFTPVEITVTDCSGRSQHQNRAIALSRLRCEIAMQVRGEVPDVPVDMSIKNPNYPLWIARIIDLLDINAFDPKVTAEAMGVSRSRLLKLLSRDKALWQFMNQCREKLGLPPLKA